ncbi:outer membrane protein assembly factor BamD [Mesonia sp. K7]|uniref:outer membrane protein assembly factor BamD n=1 Tax=Mesonia sp. K7 TaxID=2218606 RepID=UPI000DAA43B8|nr:outer membrane protein assembly factor BamD [Mesonia sp. K7]PZD79567.1 outer membrane protein assembly factor BamD [Mesonia sp. K7]
MKKILYILLVTIVFSACSEYQKALKNDDVKIKYDLASKLYEEGIQENKKSKLKKAIQLYEQILPQYRGKPQGEKISYEYANAFYELGAYYDSSYQFERFSKAYPQSEKAEEAFFKSAKSDYHISPRYTLDQTETNKAIGKFQEYITLYPDGENIGEANQLSAELREKLELKEYEIAKLYHHREEYKPAIEAFNNFIEANPGSKYREKAYFYKMESAYLLAINSYAYLVPERLETAKVYYENYKKYFPSGELNEDANIIIQDINTRLENNNS